MNRIASTRSISAACLALAVLVTVCPAEETRRIHEYRIELGRFANRQEAEQLSQSAAERTSLPLRVDSLEGGWVVTSEDYSTSRKPNRRGRLSPAWLRPGPLG
jgi:hypothetical protein